MVPSFPPLRELFQEQFEARALTERDKSGRTYDIRDVQFTSGELARFYFEVTEFADHDEAG